MKIGFFDSGLGGISILEAVIRELPVYDYLYFGDTENLPYGDKTEAQIYSFVENAVRYLFEKDCLMVILACNTASAETLRRLQDGFLAREYPDRKILGVIIPTIEELIDSGEGNTLLLATKRTVDSGKYERELLHRNVDGVHIFSCAVPELVPLIESGKIDEALSVAIRSIETMEVSSVTLGCTHYTLLKQGLREYFGEGKRIISQDEIIPEKLKTYLTQHPEIESALTKGGTRTMYLTEEREAYLLRA